MAIDSTTWLGRLSVGGKLAIIPGLFLAALAAILLYTIHSVADQEMDEVVVDMAARQRVFNQRHLAEVLLTSQGGTADYAATRRLLDETLEGLTNGGMVTINIYTQERGALPAAPTNEIREHFREQRRVLTAVFEKADEFLRLPKGDPSIPARLKELLEAAAKMDSVGNTTVKALSANSKAKIASLIRWELIAGIAAGVVGVFFSWAVGRQITGPLTESVAMARRISQGDLRGDKLTIRSQDEIGRLAEAFNAMQDSLRDLAGQSVSVTRNLNSASAEILASAQQQATGTRQQAATVQEISATMQELNQSGTQVSERAKQVATSAEATATATNTGLKAVMDTARTMETIREQVEEVARNIVALSQKTQAVGEIIATVTDIAEQANLLALNAAIEAAGAGEQGNRFSVVAGEMKNLADQAKASTVQVRSILGEIQKGINTSVMLTEEGVKRVESGKQQSDVAQQTIRELAETTQKSIQAFQQIIGATNQQQIGFEQVAKGMQDIRQAAEQAAVGTSQLEKAVASLNSLSQQLTAAVGRYQV